MYLRIELVAIDWVLQPSQYGNLKMSKQSALHVCSHMHVAALLLYEGLTHTALQQMQGFSYFYMRMC